MAGVGVGTKKGVVSEISAERVWQLDSFWNAEKEVYTVNSTPTVEKPELHHRSVDRSGSELADIYRERNPSGPVMLSVPFDKTRFG